MDRPSSEYGLYFMLNAVSYMAGNYASGRLATRIGPDRMILTGSIVAAGGAGLLTRSEEHTSELQSLMRISYAVFCLKKKKNQQQNINTLHLKRNDNERL